MRFIDPRTDFAFKKIFGSEQSKKILMSFLNAIMELSGERKIVDITIIDPYQLPKIKELKYSILDVKCKDVKGITFVVEMQLLDVEAFHKRIVYNVCKAYTNQLKQGEGYPRLNQVVGITIVDFVLFEQVSWHVTKHVIKENFSNQVFLDEILFYFVELPKFKKDLSELENIQEKWIYFLKHAGSLDVIPEKLKEDAEVIEAFEIAKIVGMSEEELELYEKYVMAKTDQVGALHLAERRAEERGEKRGKEEGIKLGKEEGIKQGKEEGIKLGEEKGKKAGIFELIQLTVSLKCPDQAEALMEKIEKIEDLDTLKEIYRNLLTQGNLHDFPSDS